MPQLTIRSNLKFGTFTFRKELYFNPIEHPIVCQLGGNDPH
jgi:hypothetical protein